MALRSVSELLDDLVELSLARTMMRDLALVLGVAWFQAMVQLLMGFVSFRSFACKICRASFTKLAWDVMLQCSGAQPETAWRGMATGAGQELRRPEPEQARAPCTFNQRLGPKHCSSSSFHRA